jgi:hypothetical protein
LRQRDRLALGLWLLGALGCSGNKGPVDSGPDSSYALPPSPVAPLAACLELASAEASFEVNCGRLAQADVGNSASGYIGAQCPPAAFAAEEAAYKAGTLAYSGVTVNCMVNALITAIGGATIPCNVGYAELNPQCGQLAWGTLGPGESCNDQYACGAGLYCPSGCGVCTADAESMDSCGPAASGAFCNAGVCNGDRCSAIIGAGQICEMSPLVCRVPLTCHAEGCQNPLGLDAGCNDDADCIDGLSCNAFSSRCLPAPEAGGDCSEQPCAMGYACLAGEDAGFRCVQLIAGGPCIITDGGPECPEFESCRDGGCLELSSIDAGCGVSTDCALGACLGGICRPLPDDSPCDTSSQCQSGNCATSTSNTCIPACQ